MTLHSSFEQVGELIRSLHRGTSMPVAVVERDWGSDNYAVVIKFQDAPRMSGQIDSQLSGASPEHSAPQAPANPK